MAANFLEELLAEWYEYEGYLVRRNVWVGKRPEGGYECELDIVAFNPETNHLVQVEPSMDSQTWADRDRRYKKKFDAGRKHIPGLFAGIELPSKIEQIGVLVYASKETNRTVAGGRLVHISKILTEIFSALKDQKVGSNAVPEHMPILRAFQFVNEYRMAIQSVWDNDIP